MTDQQLIKSTIDRLNITGKALAKTIGITLTRMNSYTAGKCNIPPDVWRGILDYEARIYERQQEVNRAASQMGAPAAETPKRRGRPRSSIK